MDPDATLRSLLKAVVAGDCEQVRELSEALTTWLDNGGFPPKTIGPWKLGQEWHVATARFVCSLAAGTLDNSLPTDKTQA